MIQGGNTNAISDDVYQITGHSEGKETLGNVEAINWQSDVDKNNPVIKPQACKRKVQGGMIVKIKIKACKDLNEYLDYGDGSCDNRATLTINGSAPQQVTLPLRFWPFKSIINKEKSIKKTVIDICSFSADVFYLKDL